MLHKLNHIIRIPKQSKESLVSKPKNPDDPEPSAEKEAKRKKKIMEENLCRLMASELEECEKEWVTYEREKAQVTFDLADRIMEQITEETTKILGELELKRFQRR